ncbi:hypothetical protein B0H17DRAFT_1145634 [Mycena rosella]|uniref:DUF6589 domain-containing protein n=1 Tax=Mycena rosella TaxID=1033263 RepID=A0AAD7CQH8_MYCRO|nr:hypothetical protein B0H17DRAFT_1145634 [Mycena rosella]
MSQNSPQSGSSRSDLDKMTPRLSQSQPVPACSRSALGAYAPSLPTPQYASGYDSFFSSSSKSTVPLLTSQKSLSDLRDTVSTFQAKFVAPAFNPHAFPTSSYDSFFTSTPSKLPASGQSCAPSPSPLSGTPSGPALAFPSPSPAFSTPRSSWLDTEFNSADLSSDTLVDTSSFWRPDPPSTPEIPALPAVSQPEKIEIILQMLRKARISTTDILLATLEKASYTASFYSDTGAAKTLLDTLYDDERGKRVITEWFTPHALDLICDRISSQADRMVKALSTHKSVSELTPKYLRSWSLKDSVAGAADRHAPDLVRVLKCLLHDRWPNYHPKIAVRPRFCWADVDDVRDSAPAKVQSGTYPIIYRLRNPNPAALNLSILLARAQNATDLDFNTDLCPSFEQSRTAHHQFCSYVIRVLCHYDKTFSPRQDEPALQSPPRRRLPDDYKTQQFPLRLCTIDESSTKGNLAVHVETHVNQLGLSYEQLTKAVLSINDQATQALNRSAKSLRAFDVNPFLRAQIFQLGIGLFHLCLNLVWAVLNVHRGHLNHHGTLAHLFVVIDKTRLGGHHPDYHSLLSALMQILDGLLLDAWRIECGHLSLAEYAASKPSATDLRAKAASILYNHGTPTRTPLTSLETSDTVRENTRRLIHDLMYVCEVTRAISDGDFGRVEDILTTLGMMFRGAGSKNYSTEILHFTHNMKKVWNDNGFDDLVRDNIIVNMTGVKNRGQGVDTNMEHHVGRVKELFAAKGLYANWERLADISAAINVIDSVKKSIAMSLDTSYSGTGHKTPDTSSLVWRIAGKARELGLNTFDARRENNCVVKASVVILSMGEAVLKSASLATFNKNRHDLLKGLEVKEERDDMPAVDLSLASPENGDCD